LTALFAKSSPGDIAGKTLVIEPDQNTVGTVSWTVSSTSTLDSKFEPRL